MRPTRVERVQLRTVLLVGEGYSEVELLTHLKKLYLVRGNGLAVTIKNARGKGAQHVIDYAIGQSRNAAFDVKIAVFDADTDWTEATKNKARAKRITPWVLEPCLEAFLLAVHGQHVVAVNSAQIKAQFRRQFGFDAFDTKVYPMHFGREALDNAAEKIALLATMLELLKN